MTIEKLAKNMTLHPDTLRYYERIGLLTKYKKCKWNTKL